MLPSWKGPAPGTRRCRVMYASCLFFLECLYAKRWRVLIAGTSLRAGGVHPGNSVSLWERVASRSDTSEGVHRAAGARLCSRGGAPVEDKGAPGRGGGSRRRRTMIGWSVLAPGGSRRSCPVKLVHPKSKRTEELTPARVWRSSMPESRAFDSDRFRGSAGGGSRSCSA